MKTLKILVSLIFVCSGIYSQNFWQQTNGPYGATVYCLAYTSAGSIFCTTFLGGGIYKSTNNGINWFKIYGENRDPSSRIITTDKYSNLYASCNEHGLIKSTDDGNTWVQLSSTLHPISIAVNNNGDIFAGLSTGQLYRSTNNGVNWVNVNFGANGVQKLLIKPNGNIYAAFPPFVRISTDNGNTWNQISYSGMSGGNDMSFDSSGNLLVCGNGIFKTTNDGINWTQINNEGTINSIGVSGNGTIYAGTNNGHVTKLTDGGTSWLTIFNNEVSGSNSQVRDIMILPDGKLFAGYYYLGVFRSIDEGVTWQRSNSGLSNQRVSTILSDGNGKIFAGSFNDGLYYTTNRGSNWVFTGLDNKYTFQVGFNGSENIFVYCPGSQGGLHRSTNGGVSWAQFNNGIPQGNINQFLKINNDLYAATDNGIYKTTNNGNNWIIKSPNAFRFKYIKENINHLLFAASDSRLYRSSDLGENWQALDSLGYYIEGFCIKSPDNVYCISSNRLYRSTNFGSTWFITDSTANYDNLTCNNDGVLFVSDWDGIYRSMDFGSNWEQINSGLTFTDITALSFDEQGYIFAGTWGGGVFGSLQSTVSINISGNGTSFENYSLSQNYPNPFNPVTNIKYQIPKSGFVKISIYNLLGKEIVQLVNQQMQPGSYYADWDASNYPSGVYFYKLETDGFVDSKKMVLVK